jgi:hypothetical protein
MPWGVAAAVAGSVVSSVLAPDQATAGQGATSGAAGAADPFASQRPQYQQQLQDMMKPGASFNATDPAYQASFSEGQRSLESAAAAGGGFGSGAEKAALVKYGSDQAATQFSNQFSRLSQLAGANVGSPAAAGQLVAQGNQQQQGGATAIGSAVGSAINNWGNRQSNPAGMTGENTASVMYGSGDLTGGSSVTPGIDYMQQATPAVDFSSWSSL